MGVRIIQNKLGTRQEGYSVKTALRGWVRTLLDVLYSPHLI